MSEAAATKTAWRSGIYRGWIRHRRFAPRPHKFRRPLFMMYLDLDEVDEIFRNRWLWASGRWAPACFLRRDFLGDPSIPLREAVLDLVEERTGQRPAGSVRLLTHLRYFGYIFNPLKLYYCFGEATGGEAPLEAIVAEVHNTPWGEVHHYVLSRQAGEESRSGTQTAHHPKAFHVSPFLPMELAYDWRITPPAENLLVHIAVGEEGEARHLFDATLRLRRTEISGRSLAAVLLRHPWMTASVLAAIYVQAFRLWWKKTPFHPHPRPKGAE